jgi:glycosyltransferase involved in cell wall biosynthesis
MFSNQKKVTLFTDYRFATTPTPTGVTKHAYFMARGLMAEPRFQVSGLVAADQIGHQGCLDFLPPVRLPMSWKLSRELWTWTGHPVADRWLGDADWVYCPKNDWIPVRKAKYAVTIHGAHELDPAYASPSRSLRQRWVCQRTRRQYLKMCERADVVLTVSEWLKAFVVEQFHGDPRKIVVVGNGVDRIFYEAKAATTPASHYILCLGGLNHIDGGDRILALAGILKRDGRNWQIKIAGSQHDPGMAEQARQTGVIELLGHVSHTQLASLMAGALAFYYPTRYETFGMGAAEAMAAGTPVVTSHCTAVPEIVGDCGLYVNPDKASEAWDAIVSLATDTMRRQDLIARARERAKRFTWDDCVERLKTVFV